MTNFTCGIGVTFMLVAPIAVLFIQAIAINWCYGNRIAICFSSLIFLLLAASSTPFVTIKIAGCWSEPITATEIFLALGGGLGMYLLGFFGFKFPALILDAWKNDP